MKPSIWIWTIPLAGLLGFAVLILRGAISIAETGATEASLLGASSTLLYHYLLLIAYVLPIPGFIKLYEETRNRGAGQNLPFTGLLFLVWGTALALPALGNLAFIPVAMKNLEPANAQLGITLVRESILGPGMPIGIVAAITYSLGAIFLAIPVWRLFRRARLAVLLFAVHGALLSFGFSYYPLLLAGWIALFLGGTGLALTVRSS